MSDYRGRGRGRSSFVRNHYRGNPRNIFNDHIRNPNPNNYCSYGPSASISPNYRERPPRWQKPVNNQGHSSQNVHQGVNPGPGLYNPGQFKWNNVIHQNSHYPRPSLLGIPPLIRPYNGRPPCLPPPQMPRSLSPLPGSEEARQKAIAEASARIKVQLNLSEPNSYANSYTKASPCQDDIISDDSEKIIEKPEQIVKKKTRRSISSSQDCDKNVNVHELRNKILSQFTSMSKGRIQNLVNNPGSTKYDAALQHLVRDMRLHLSSELRNMYNSRECERPSEMIDHFNSLVPDLGVELASLPDTIVDELSNILQLDINNMLDSSQNVQNDLIQPEQFFKQAQRMLTDSNFNMGDNENSSFTPVIDMDFSVPPPNIFPFIEESQILNYDSNVTPSSNTDLFQMKIEQNLLETPFPKNQLFINNSTLQDICLPALTEDNLSSVDLENPDVNLAEDINYFFDQEFETPSVDQFSDNYSANLDIPNNMNFTDDQHINNFCSTSSKNSQNIVPSNVSNCSRSNEQLFHSQMEDDSLEHMKSSTLLGFVPLRAAMPPELPKDNSPKINADLLNDEAPGTNPAKIHFAFKDLKIVHNPDVLKIMEPSSSVNKAIKKLDNKETKKIDLVPKETVPKEKSNIEITPVIETIDSSKRTNVCIEKTITGIEKLGNTDNLRPDNTESIHSRDVSEVESPDSDEYNSDSLSEISGDDNTRYEKHRGEYSRSREKDRDRDRRDRELDKRDRNRINSSRERARDREKYKHFPHNRYEHRKRGYTNKYEKYKHYSKREYYKKDKQHRSKSTKQKNYRSQSKSSDSSASKIESPKRTRAIVSLVDNELPKHKVPLEERIKMLKVTETKKKDDDDNKIDSADEIINLDELDDSEIDDVVPIENENKKSELSLSKDINKKNAEDFELKNTGRNSSPPNEKDLNDIDLTRTSPTRQFDALELKIELGINRTPPSSIKPKQVDILELKLDSGRPRRPSPPEELLKEVIDISKTIDDMTKIVNPTEKIGDNTPKNVSENTTLTPLSKFKSKILERTNEFFTKELLNFNISSCEVKNKTDTTKNMFSVEKSNKIDLTQTDDYKIMASEKKVSEKITEENRFAKSCRDFEKSLDRKIKIGTNIVVDILQSNIQTDINNYEALEENADFTDVSGPTIVDFTTESSIEKDKRPQKIKLNRSKNTNVLKTTSQTVVTDSRKENVINESNKSSPIENYIKIVDISEPNKSVEFSIESSKEESTNIVCEDLPTIIRTTTKDLARLCEKELRIVIDKRIVEDRHKFKIVLENTSKIEDLKENDYKLDKMDINDSEKSQIENTLHHKEKRSSSKEKIDKNGDKAKQNVEIEVVNNKKTDNSKNILGKNKDLKINTKAKSTPKETHDKKNKNTIDKSKDEQKSHKENCGKTNDKEVVKTNVNDEPKLDNKDTKQINEKRIDNKDMKEKRNSSKERNDKVKTIKNKDTIKEPKLKEVESKKDDKLKESDDRKIDKKKLETHKDNSSNHKSDSKKKTEHEVIDTKMENEETENNKQTEDKNTVKQNVLELDFEGFDKLSVKVENTPIIDDFVKHEIKGNDDKEKLKVKFEEIDKKLKGECDDDIKTKNNTKREIDDEKTDLKDVDVIQETVKTEDKEKIVDNLKEIKQLKIIDIDPKEGNTKIDEIDKIQNSKEKDTETKQNKKEITPKPSKENNDKEQTMKNIKKHNKKPDSKENRKNSKNDNEIIDKTNEKQDLEVTTEDVIVKEKAVQNINNYENVIKEQKDKLTIDDSKSKKDKKIKSKEQHNRENKCKTLETIKSDNKNSDDNTHTKINDENNSVIIENLSEMNKDENETNIDKNKHDENVNNNINVTIELLKDNIQENVVELVENTKLIISSASNKDELVTEELNSNKIHKDLNEDDELEENKNKSVRRGRKKSPINNKRKLKVDTVIKPEESSSVKENEKNNEEINSIKEVVQKEADSKAIKKTTKKSERQNSKAKNNKRNVSHEKILDKKHEFTIETKSDNSKEIDNRKSLNSPMKSEEDSFESGFLGFDVHGVKTDNLNKDDENKNDPTNKIKGKSEEKRVIIVEEIAKDKDDANKGIHPIEVNKTVEKDLTNNEINLQELKDNTKEPGKVETAITVLLQDLEERTLLIKRNNEDIDDKSKRKRRLHDTVETNDEIKKSRHELDNNNSELKLIKTKAERKSNSRNSNDHITKKYDKIDRHKKEKTHKHKSSDRSKRKSRERSLENEYKKSLPAIKTIISLKQINSPMQSSLSPTTSIILSSKQSSISTLSPKRSISPSTSTRSQNLCQTSIYPSFPSLSSPHSHSSDKVEKVFFKSRETIMNRMMTIDMEIQKLMQEKWDLYKELQLVDLNNAKNDSSVDDNSEKNLIRSSGPLSTDDAMKRGELSLIDNANMNVPLLIKVTDMNVSDNNRCPKIQNIGKNHESKCVDEVIIEENDSLLIIDKSKEKNRKNIKTKAKKFIKTPKKRKSKTGKKKNGISDMAYDANDKLSQMPEIESIIQENEISINETNIFDTTIENQMPILKPIYNYSVNENVPEMITDNTMSVIESVVRNECDIVKTPSVHIKTRKRKSYDITSATESNSEAENKRMKNESENDILETNSDKDNNRKRGSRKGKTMRKHKRATKKRMVNIEVNSDTNLEVKEAEIQLPETPSKAKTRNQTRRKQFEPVELSESENENATKNLRSRTRNATLQNKEINSDRMSSVSRASSEASVFEEKISTELLVPERRKKGKRKPKSDSPIVKIDSPEIESPTLPKIDIPSEEIDTKQSGKHQLEEVQSDQEMKPCFVHLERIRLHSPERDISVTDVDNVSLFNTSQSVELVCDLDHRTLSVTDVGKTQKEDECLEVSSTSDVSAVDQTATAEIALTQNGTFCLAHTKSILDIKVVRNEFLAASEDGCIYRYSLRTGKLNGVYPGHTMAVTCLYVPRETTDNTQMFFSGSLDCCLRCYRLDNCALVHTVTAEQAIQCMDSAWGYIFLGTYDGLLFIYDIKKKHLHDNSITVASATVLMVKATTEGGRQVLILASRKREIMVRDAFTGLLLRTMCEEQKPTIYSLLLERSFVYCGTSDKGILVLDFNSGQQVRTYNAGKGVVCMLIYRCLLFAGCYDGMIYVFNTRTNMHVSTIDGPGEGMLLSLAIVNDLIIAGTKKDHLLKIWKVPQDILSECTD